MPGWGDVINQMGLRRPARARFDGMRRTGRGSMGGGARNNGNGGGGGNNRGGNNGGGGNGRAPGFYTVTRTTPAPTGQEALTNTGFGVGADQWATMAPLANTTQQQYNQADDFARLNNAQQQQLGGLGSGMVLDVNAAGGIPLSVAPNTFLQDSTTGLSNWQAVAGALENWKPVTVTQEYGVQGGGGNNRRRNRNRR